MIKNKKELIALVVGGTNGIGRASAIKLAQRGYNVIIVGRNANAGGEVIKEIEKAGSIGRFVQGDLSLMKEVQRIATEIHKITTQIHILLHCADVALAKRVDTSEGIEVCFATNFLSRVLLNELLMDLLKASAPAQILHISTPGMNWKTDPKLVPPPPEMSSSRSHNIGQGANNLYTVDLANRLDGSGIRMNVMAPGWVDTGFHKNVGEESLFYRLFMPIMRWAIKTFTSQLYTPEQCADNVLYMLLSDETSKWNGKFVKSNGKEAMKVPAYYKDPQRRKMYLENSQSVIEKVMKA